MSIAVMLAIMAGITSVPTLAASNGIYIATATPHYKHPTTGVIEDAGGDGSSVLGQSMTESATYKKALVEVDPQGNTYITIRLQLMDNIQNPQFQVDGSSVSASLMQEDYTNNTADYRMKVNSENSVIRCNMYVIAMGRDVIFYITVSDLQAGSGDFITSVKVEQPIQSQTLQETQQPVQSQTLQETQQSVQSQTLQETQLPAQTAPSGTESATTDSTKTSDFQTEEPDTTEIDGTESSDFQTEEPDTTEIDGTESSDFQTEEPDTTEIDGTESSDFQTQEPDTTEIDGTESSDFQTEEPDTTEPEISEKDEDTELGLQEFDKDGNKVESNSKDTKNDTAKSGNNVVWWLLGGIVLVVAAGGCVWYFCFFKKKK
jgi:hypothetical protein